MSSNKNVSVDKIMGLSLILFCGFFSGSVEATKDSVVQSVDVSLVTQNLYLGADAGKLLEGEAPSTILKWIKDTHFPYRATGLANSMSRTENGLGKSAPDVIALQEVITIWTTDKDGNKTKEVDFLDELKRALKEVTGVEYISTYRIDGKMTDLISKATQLKIPYCADCPPKQKIIFNLDNVTLVKPGIEVESWESYEYSEKNQFAINIWPERGLWTHIPVNLISLLIGDLTGYDKKKTIFGSTLLEFTRTAGIAVLKKEGVRFTVVNTHLQDINIFFDRNAQAEELMSYLKRKKYINNPKAPVFLLGDLNSPKINLSDSSPGSIYEIMQNKGCFTDLVSDPDTEVSTCCREENLIGDGFMSDGQIDYIMYSDYSSYLKLLRELERNLDEYKTKMSQNAWNSRLQKSIDELFQEEEEESPEFITTVDTSTVSSSLLGTDERDRVKVGDKLLWSSDHLGGRVNVKIVVKRTPTLLP